MTGIRRDPPPHTPYLRAVTANRSPATHDDSGHGPFTNSSIERDALAFGDQPNARDFEMMLTSYLWSGGMARSADVSRHLAERQGDGHSSVERLLATNAIFGFDWRGSLWVPMFQFDASEMFVKPHSRQVLPALTGVFDGWTIACWYLEPNLWLQNRRPIDLLDANPLAVLDAARGDRFIATNSLMTSQH